MHRNTESLSTFRETVQITVRERKKHKKVKKNVILQARDVNSFLVYIHNSHCRHTKLYKIEPFNG